MKVLVTGFDPFGQEQINPSYEAVKLLPDRVLDAEIIKAQLPTAFIKGFLTLKDLIKKHSPDFILCCGQAGGRNSVTLEKVAVNYCEGIDNDGFNAAGITVVEGGADGLFSTVDVNAVSNRLKQKGIPVFVSYTAGTFVCNSVLYNTLHYAKTNNLSCKTAFVHIPFAPIQVKNTAQPSLPIDYVKGILIEIIEQIMGS